MQVDICKQRHRALTRSAAATVMNPSSRMPALSHFWIRRMMRLSPIRYSRKRASHSSLTLPKKFRVSGSRIQFTFRRSIATHRASNASCGPRPGRNPNEKPQKSPSYRSKQDPGEWTMQKGIGLLRPVTEAGLPPAGTHQLSRAPHPDCRATSHGLLRVAPARR